MKETIALIDGDSLIYYEMGKPTLEEALSSLDGRLHQMFEMTHATQYAGFLTSGKCFRYAAAKTKPYKGNRKYGDKPIIFPAIKEYLDIKVKNDEQLVKMAAIVQRLVVGEQKGSSEVEFGLSDTEKSELLKSLEPVAKDLQKYTDEINSQVESDPSNIVES